MAPSDKIRVALIGGRNMGWSDLETFLKFPQVQCVSICDIDDEWLNKRASDTEKIAGKKPPLLTKDWRKVMDNRDIDAVIVATPDHWHCPAGNRRHGNRQGCLLRKTSGKLHRRV